MDFLVASNLLVLLPVIAVVAGVVLVFVFGFKQPSQPKKFTPTSDSNKKPKKKDTKVSPNTIYFYLATINETRFLSWTETCSKWRGWES